MKQKNEIDKNFLAAQNAVLSVILYDAMEGKETSWEASMNPVKFLSAANRKIAREVSKAVVGEYFTENWFLETFPNHKHLFIGEPYVSPPFIAARELRHEYVLHAASELADKVAGAGNIEDKIRELQASVEGIVSISKKEVSKGKTLAEAMKELDETGPTALFPINFHAIDKYTNRATPYWGHLWVIGAYQKTGKTTLVLQVINRLIAQGVGVRFISLEMSELEVAKRIKRINSHDVVISKPEDFELLRISELAAPTIEDVIDEITYCEESVIVIDYLQIIDSKLDEIRAMEKIPMMLKNAARKANKFIIALSQIGHGANAEKSMSSAKFKGSSNIGAAADFGFFIIRDHDQEAQNTSITRHHAELYFRLNRHGPTGSEKIYWDSSCGLFFN